MSRGFLSFAQNTEGVDYLKLAYLQALSIKTSNTINQYAVVVDAETAALVTDQQRQVFDYVIEIPLGDDAKNSRWKMQNEWKAQMVTPFDETIKLESDMLIPQDIEHWWNILSAKDICFTTQIYDFRGNPSTTRAYREAFDANNLPDIYAGFYYFKNNDAVKPFFDLSRDIFKNWNYVRTHVLKDCVSAPASTDLVFALAAQLYGIENCSLPNNVPAFVHMKGAVQGWDIGAIWMEYLYYQFDRTRFTTGFHRQSLPFHYYHKSFATEDVIKNYERIYFG